MTALIKLIVIGITVYAIKVFWDKFLIYGFRSKNK